MKRTIIRMKFLAPIHIGDRNLSDSNYDIKADTLFSALCIECGDIPRLVNTVKDGKLKISDAFPYIDGYYYIPKPMIVVKHETKDYKLFKKIKYISHDRLDEYIEGSLKPEVEIERFILGDSDVRTQVCIGEDPYQVGTYTFKDNTGLYVIVEHSDDYIFEIFERLQYAGIGGKRSSGFGRFSFELEDCFDFTEGNKKILLNTAMARDDELDNALIDASYQLQKRSGFIHQSKYKKKDFYTFKAGSVFDNEFQGDVFDVGNDEHPVYRYGIPMFMGVKLC